jgi:sialate O-acetylesterase
LFLLAAGSARADVALNGIFSDHMVLQRDMPLPFWGTANPGEKVSVTVAGQEAETTAGADGKWKVSLAPLKAGGPFTIEVAGTNKITLNDVLVGDVWLCSGQSNMAFSMSWIKNAPAYADDLKTANFPEIRQGSVPRVPSVHPIDTTAVKWAVCTPETVGDFTAAGFYFARNIHKELNVPIGLILSAWGGTSAESWTSIDALDTVPAFKQRAEDQLKNLAGLPEQIKNFPGLLHAWQQKYGRVDTGNEGEAKGWAQPDADTSGWQPAKLNATWKEDGVPNGGIIWLRKSFDIPPGVAGKGFRLDLGQVEEQYTTAYFNGQLLGESGSKAPEFYSGYAGYSVPGDLVKPGKNVLAIRFVSDQGDKHGTSRKPDALGLFPLGISGLDDDCLIKVEKEFPPLTPAALAELPPCPKGDAPHTSSTLFGGMIHPIIPVAIKGCIWYQGEQDGSRGHAYRTLLPLMINDWRGRWGQGDFPFLVQQLPNWGAVSKDPQESGWASLREAQSLTARNLPNVHLSVAIDIGEINNVHPQNKREVGRRLALVALATVYGRPVAYTGPVFESMSVDSSAIRLKFAHAEGLKSGDGQPLKMFAIAGDDHHFVWGDAKIDGNSVIVSSPQVQKPVAVRYAWADSPAGCNLTNSSGLPASPFRTDSWPLPTDSGP